MNRLKKSYSTCMSCGGKKMKSGGKWIQSAIKKPGSFTAQAKSAGMSVPAFRDKVLSNKEKFSSTTVKRANLAKTLSGMRKGEDGMITRKGTKEVMKYASRVEPRGITTESSMGMPATPTPIESPANWYNESTWDKAQAENAARPVANTPVSSANPATVKGGSPKVKAYQEMLRSKGYNIAADGAWGAETQKAYEAYIKSKTTAAAKPASVPAKTTSKSSSQNWNYSASQWDAAQRENAMRPVAGATYGPTKANKMNFAPVNKPAVAPKAPIAAPGKPAAKKTTPDQMPAWAKKVVAQNSKTPVRKSPINLR
jgi:hypothetical protein